MKDYPNKIEWGEAKGFVPMKLSGCEYTYRHWDNRRMESCPTHKAKFMYHSATDSFEKDFGDGKDVCIDGHQMDLVYDWIERMRIKGEPKLEA